MLLKDNEDTRKEQRLLYEVNSIHGINIKIIAAACFFLQNLLFLQ